MIEVKLLLLKLFDFFVLILLAAIVGVITLWAPSATWGTNVDILIALVWGASINFLNSTKLVGSNIFKKSLE